MSVLLTGLVLKSDMPKTEKWTLVILADRADDEGESIYYKIDTMAKRASLDRRTIQRMLRKFEEIGLIKAIEPATGRSPATYKIDVQMLEDIVDEGWHPVARGDTLPPLKSTPATPEVAPSHPRDDTLPPDTSFDPLANPFNEIWVKALAYIRTTYYSGPHADLHEFDSVWGSSELQAIDVGEMGTLAIVSCPEPKFYLSRFDAIVAHALIAAGQRVDIVTFTQNSPGTE